MIRLATQNVYVSTHAVLEHICVARRLNLFWVRYDNDWDIAFKTVWNTILWKMCLLYRIIWQVSLLKGEMQWSILYKYLYYKVILVWLPF